MFKLKKIAVLLLVLTVVFSTVGCSLAGSPTKAFDDLMAAFIDTDGEKMVDYINDKEYSPFMTYMDLPVELSNLLIDKLVLTKYVVKSETLAEDKKSAELEVEFTYFDTGARMAEAHIIIKKETEEGAIASADFDETQAYIAETFTEYLTNDVPEVTETYTLTFSKNDKGKWVYEPLILEEMIDPLYNIFSGNLIAYINAVNGYTGE